MEIIGTVIRTYVCLFSYVSSFILYIPLMEGLLVSEISYYPTSTTDDVKGAVIPIMMLSGKASLCVFSVRVCLPT